MKRRRSNRVLSILLLVIVLGPLSLISPALDGAATVSAAVTGPDSAVTVSGDWDQVSVGGSRWYAFQYAGDSSQIEVKLQAVPEGSATVVVWTPEEIRMWNGGSYVEPIGRGSTDPNVAGTLVWTGHFTVAGIYYVTVEHADGYAGTSYYLLTVSGSGVYAPKAAATSTSTTSAKAKAKDTTPAVLSGKLVFQTSYGGVFYTINADGTNLKRITDGIDPVWSPDGTQIAFTRWTDPRGVWVVNADGSGARRVFDWSEARYPSWSPRSLTAPGGGTGGQEIVFSRLYGKIPGSARRGGPPGGGGKRGGPPGGGGGGGASTIWRLGIVNPADGQFSEPLPNSDVSLTPDWSPDGTQIVYDAVQGLRLQSVDGQQSYQLTSDPKDTSPVWSPDGTQVAFVRRQNDHWEIYVVNAGSGNVRRLTDTPALANGTAADSVSPAWSPDGKSIAFFTNRTGKWEIWVMAADGSGQRAMFGSQLAGLTLDYAYVSDRAISWTE